MTSLYDAAWRRTDVAHGLGLVSLAMGRRGSRASGREIVIEQAPDTRLASP
ncbi:MAG: hypothetical protein ACRDK3_08765 [Actinomycetota bacterium]